MSAEWSDLEKDELRRVLSSTVVRKALQEVQAEISERATGLISADLHTQDGVLRAQAAQATIQGMQRTVDLLNELAEREDNGPEQ